MAETFIDLSGQKLLVTAAGAGIGRAIALGAARAGGDVLATDIDAVALEGLKAEGIAVATLDATDPAAVDALVAAHGPFGRLAHAVGYVHHGTVLDCGHDDWHRSFRINVDSMYYVLQAVLPGMIEMGGGSIVSIASMASSIKGFVNRAAYGATKAAVIGLTKAVAVDFMDKNIRCNTICPGTVDSPSLRQRVEELGKTMGGYDKAYAAFVARQPMGRLGTAEEIATLALYLVSDAASYTTGQAHVIDGGTTA